MSNLTGDSRDTADVTIAVLSPTTREALSRSAEVNGRSINEEAEDIIRTHLQAATEDKTR